MARLRTAVLIAAIVVVAAVQAVLVEDLARSRTRDEQRAEARNAAATVGAALQERILANLAILSGLATYIEVDATLDPDAFTRYAEAIYRSPNDLLNVAVAEGYVIRHVYPRAGNAAILGTDYRDVPGQLASVQRAIETRRRVVNGPVDLIQGGRGIVGRVPVFTATDGDGAVFWGVVSGIIDWDRIVRGVRERAGDADVAVAIRTVGGEAVFGDPALFADGASPVQQIDLGYERWEIVAQPAGGWPEHSPYRRIIIFTAAMAALMVSLLVVIRHRAAERIALTELQLRRQRELVDRYVISSQTDPDGIITHVSDAYCRVAGYSREEMVGAPQSIVRHPEAPEELFRDMWATLRAGDDWSGEFPNRAKDGSTFWVDASIAPVRSEGGETVGYAAILRDVTARREVERLSVTDTLTGVANRLACERVLEREHERYRRYRHALSVILFDLDRFKALNDTYGHNAGDAALRRVGAILTTRVRSQDTAGRWGGEEFLIVCPETDLAGASELARHLRNALHAADWGDTPAVTASFGVAEATPDESPERLIGRADDALYCAKLRGRDRIEAQGCDAGGRR